MPRREVPPQGHRQAVSPTSFVGAGLYQPRAANGRSRPLAPRRRDAPGNRADLRFSGPADPASPRQPPQGVKQPPRCSIFLLDCPQSLNKTKQKTCMLAPPSSICPLQGPVQRPGGAAPPALTRRSLAEQVHRIAKKRRIWHSNRGEIKVLGTSAPVNLAPVTGQGPPLPVKATPLLSRRSPLPPVRCTRWPMPWRQASRWEFDIA